MKMLRIKLLLQEIYIFGFLLIVSCKRNEKKKTHLDDSYL